MVYLFSHKQRASVSIWLLSLALNSHEKEREREGNERERHLNGSTERIKNKPQTIKKMAIGTYISRITLNVNGLIVPTKRHRLA